MDLASDHLENWRDNGHTTGIATASAVTEQPTRIASAALPTDTEGFRGRDRYGAPLSGTGGITEDLSPLGQAHASCFHRNGASIARPLRRGPDAASRQLQGRRDNRHMSSRSIAKRAAINHGAICQGQRAHVYPDVPGVAIRKCPRPDEGITRAA